MPFARSLFGFAMANLTQSASLEKKIAEAEAHQERLCRIYTRKE